ncbi:MAG: hypothetical protein HDS79_08270 [Bacteroidales bacterium]|nr:hypothetical protein [Bacteroidales bacterium]
MDQEKNFDIDFLKSLEVTVEEWDPEPEEDEEGAYYTDWYIVGEHFTDEQIEDAIKEYDHEYLEASYDCETEDQFIGCLLMEMVREDIYGQLKSITVKDLKTDKVLFEDEFAND